MADIERGIFSGSRVRPKGNGAPASKISYGDSNVESILDWQLGSYEYPTAVSGAVTIDPSLGARISANVDGNITSLTVALSETYPSVTLELTTTGAGFTIDATGWSFDGGGTIALPDTDKAVFQLWRSPDGTLNLATVDKDSDLVSVEASTAAGQFLESNGSGGWSLSSNINSDPAYLDVFGGAWRFSSTALQARGYINAAFIQRVPGSLTDPVFASNTDTNSGLGFNAASIVGLVAGAKSGLQVDGTGTGTVTTIRTDTAEIAAVTDVLKLHHATSGTAGDGFGIGILFTGEDALGATQTLGSIDFKWLSESAGTTEGVIGGIDRLTLDVTEYGIGVTPTAVQTGYTTFTNLTTTRTGDADTLAAADLADILGTLIEDLKAKGIISA